MSGYRRQIRRACRELGKRGRTFDYKDVLSKLPAGAYRPTEWQVIRALQHASYVEVAREGDRHRLTKYRLRGRPTHQAK